MEEKFKHIIVFESDSADYIKIFRELIKSLDLELLMEYSVARRKGDD